MNKIIIGIFGILIVASVILFSGCSTQTTEKIVANDAMQKDTATDDTMMTNDGDTMMEKENVMEQIDTEEPDAMMEKINDTSMEQQGDAMMKIEDDSMMTTFSGNVLAGTTSQYIEFNKEDYDKALASGKTIVLNFYADWCPSCKAEQPDAYDTFNQLNKENVVGFRVNYKDSNTDSDETELAKEFGIAYQHTKVIIKDGTQVVKSPETWDVQRYIDEINMYS